MKKFLKFMEVAAMPIGIVPWTLLYIQGGKLFHYEPIGWVSLTLLAFQFTGMFFQVGFAVRSYLQLRALKKQMKDMGL